MRGFTVWLIPLDPSGAERNKEFVRSNGGKLMGGGRAEMQPDGRLKCTWLFDGFKGAVPDVAKGQMLVSFTNSLDKAIARKTNVRYEVEFIEDGPLG